MHLLPMLSTHAYFVPGTNPYPLEQENRYILLVDDSVLVSERLAALLPEAGIDLPLLRAADYAQAVDIIAQRPPFIAVLDINLPGRNGLELLRTIRTLHEEIIVIMLSNRTGYYYRQVAQELGADYFLDKSNDFEHLPSLLHRLIYP